jgi:glycosyltransferase involved in cell wall biosynthesis
LVEAIEKWGLNRSEAVVTVSGPAAETLNEYGLNIPIYAVPNGIHPASFPRLDPEERSKERRRLGLTARHIVGFQGTFQAFHGIDRLRELMMSTADRSDTQWLIIGDGPELSKLQRSVTGKVPAVFLGRQPSERMGGLLGLLDIGVAPYSHVPGSFYGCPLKVLEYAAAGCAVIASGQGDVPALLDNSRAGVVLRSDDSRIWTRELEDMLNEPARYELLGEYARKWVFSRFTWQQTAERLDQILTEAMDRFARGRRSSAQTVAPSCVTTA